MKLETVDRSWTYGICESCLRNCHEEHNMLREFLVDTNDETKKIEVWICPNCGSVRRF